MALAACRALDRGDLARARALAAEVMNGLAALESHRRELGAARQRRYQAKTDDAKPASDLTATQRQTDDEIASDDAKTASARASSLSSDPKSFPDLSSHTPSRPQSARPGNDQSASARETVEQLLRARNPRLGGQGGLIEAVAALLAELGLRRVDSTGHAIDLGWIAQQPVSELRRVAETLLGDPWAQGHMGRASQPAHLRKRWQVYLDGPEQPDAPQEDPELVAVRVKKLRADLQTAEFLAKCEQGERAAAHEREAKRLEAELAKLSRAS